MSVIVALIVFGIIVLIHELGHFIAARKNGILVEEFAIGMGTKIFGIKKGDTLYSLRLLPLGGYCKMLGEDEGCGDDRAFNNKTVLQRVVVISAGVVMNFLLAFIIFTTLAMTNGITVTQLSFVAENSPAMEAGLQVGDKITHINGTKMNIYEDLSAYITESRGQNLLVRIDRNGQILEKEIIPRVNESGRYMIGIASDAKTGFLASPIEGFERAGLIETVQNGFWQILFWIKQTFLGIIKLFTFSLSLDELAGPIGIVNVIGETYEQTLAESLRTAIQTMVKFTAILSANLGVFNLLPLPALDGGRLVFLTLEGIRKKPIPPEKEGMIHFMGFVLLMALALVIAYNDLMKIL